MNPLPESMVAALVQAVANGTSKDGIRLIDRKENDSFSTWSEIAQRASCAAATLAKHGVKTGDRVIIILPTCMDFIDSWFGCLWLGAIPVALYPPVRLGRLDEYFRQTSSMIDSVDASGLIADRRVRRVIGRLMTESNIPLGLIKSEELITETRLEPYFAHPDDTAMIQFSSGTTIAPKPVALSHQQIIANADAIMDFFPLNDGVDHVGVSWLPLYHDMGLIGCIVPAVLRYGQLNLIPPEVFLARPAIWLRSISRYKGTLSPAPDFAYGLCVQKIRDEEMEGCDLSSWRLAMNGAESVSAKRSQSFIERFQAWGFNPQAMLPVYGLSEASLAVTFSDPTRPFLSVQLNSNALAKGEVEISDSAEETTQITSVGQPLRGFSVEIRSKDGQKYSDSRVGHIWVHGPSIMKGYIGDIPSPIVKGWLHTGDLGFLLDGNLYITGRAKDMIVLRGKNHSPVDIEEALDVVPELRMGCSVAVGAVDSDGEKLLVFAESREIKKDTATSCQRAIRAQTGLEPDLVVMLEPGVLPRTSSGKIRRGETLRRWQTGTLVPPDRVTPWLLTGVMARSALSFLKAKQRSNE